jgi:hypothetical protein
MPEVVTLPYSNGMDFGKGVNLRDCTVLGNAVNSGPTKTVSASGMTVTYEFKEKTSLEDLYSALGIDVELAGRYAAVSASGKTRYANQVKFNSQSTFILARCIVENPYEQIENPQLLEPPGNLLKAGNQTAFQDQYGDGFVRGMLTGGEFHAVISITSSSKSEQEEVAVALQAKYGALIASGSLDGSLDDNTKNIVKRAKLDVSTFQRGGQGDQTAFAADLEAVMTRMARFPAACVSHPVPYTMDVATYKTIALPQGPSPFEIEAQALSLADYARDYLKLRQLANDVEFMQLYPNAFKTVPPPDTLNRWARLFATQLDDVVAKSAACAKDPRACKAFSLQIPNDYVLPERSPGISGKWQSVHTTNDVPPQAFTSQWAFTPKDGNKYEVIETGLSNARGAGVLNGQAFVFHWVATNPGDTQNGTVSLTFTPEFDFGQGTVNFSDGRVLQTRFTLIS